MFVSGALSRTPPGGFQRPQLANVGSHHCRGPHRIAGPMAPRSHDPPLSTACVRFDGETISQHYKVSVTNREADEEHRPTSHELWVEAKEVVNVYSSEEIRQENISKYQKQKWMVRIADERRHAKAK